MYVARLLGEGFCKHEWNIAACIAQHKGVVRFHLCCPVTGVEQQGCSKVCNSTV